MQESTKFQDWWANMFEQCTYLMFGWVCELEPPEWRIILLPVGIITMFVFLIPTLFFGALDIIVNGEFYN